MAEEILAFKEGILCDYLVSSGLTKDALGVEK